MSLNYSCSMMFIGSFLIQYFIMSTIMVFQFKHIQFSLGKFYMSLIMALMMVFLEILMHDIYYKNISYKYYLFTSILLLIIIYLYKNQINITDKEYLKEMIEHHSMALLTSNEIKKKTNNQQIKNLANNIINTQNDEINLMQNLVNKN